MCRCEPNGALDWRHAIENCAVIDLRKQKLYLAPMFLEAARAFLSMQASSASAERLFGDSGYQEGARRQTGDSSVTAVPLLIRSYIHLRLDSAPRHGGFICGQAQVWKGLAIKAAQE